MAKSRSTASPARRRSKKVNLPARRERRVNNALPPGVCRVDQQSTRTYGFVVRVGHRRSAGVWRPKFTAYFGDFSHGGRKAALAAAVRWLRILEKTGKPPAKK
jgi:hypothetical protein